MEVRNALSNGSLDKPPPQHIDGFASACAVVVWCWLLLLFLFLFSSITRVLAYCYRRREVRLGREVCSVKRGVYDHVGSKIVHFSSKKMFCIFSFDANSRVSRFRSAACCVCMCVRIIAYRNW